MQEMEGAYCLRKELITAVKSFIEEATGVDLMGLFLHKFNHTFCKQNHFKNICNICIIAVKIFSLH
jgi:hypothetical protein